MFFFQREGRKRPAFFRSVLLLARVDQWELWAFELFVRWKIVCCGLLWFGCGVVISLLSWS